MKPPANEASNSQKCLWIKAGKLVDKTSMNSDVEGLCALVRKNLTVKMGRQRVLAYIVRNRRRMKLTCKSRKQVAGLLFSFSPKEEPHLRMTSPLKMIISPCIHLRVSGLTPVHKTNARSSFGNDSYQRVSSDLYNVTFRTDLPRNVNGTASHALGNA